MCVNRKLAEWTQEKQLLEFIFESGHSEMVKQSMMLWQLLAQQKLLADHEFKLLWSACIVSGTTNDCFWKCGIEEGSWMEGLRCVTCLVQQLGFFFVMKKKISPKWLVSVVCVN